MSHCVILRLGITWKKILGLSNGVNCFLGVYMSQFSINRFIMSLLVGLQVMSSYAWVREDIKKIRVTTEAYHQHYKRFEKYIFKNRSELWWGRKTHTVEIGAKVFGYDEFVIKVCIPSSYSFFDRPVKNIQHMLKLLSSDDCIYCINMLLEKCSQRPGDLNFIARVTYEFGKQLEQAKINETGRPVSAEDRDIFVAIGLFARYWIEKKLPL